MFLAFDKKNGLKYAKWLRSVRTGGTVRHEYVNIGLVLDEERGASPLCAGGPEGGRGGQDLLETDRGADLSLDSSIDRPTSRSHRSLNFR